MSCVSRCHVFLFVTWKATHSLCYTVYIDDCVNDKECNHGNMKSSHCWLDRKLTAHVVWTAGVLSVVRHQLLSIFTLRRQQVTQTLVTHCTVTDYIVTQLKCSFQFTVLMVNHFQSHSGSWSHRRLSVGSSWCHQPGWWSPLPLDGTPAPPRWSSHTRRGRWCHCHSGTCSRHPSRLPTPRRVHEEPRSCRCRLEEFIKKIQHVIRNVWFFSDSTFS